jgi:superfamily II DNA or RNA helicase
MKNATSRSSRTLSKLFAKDEPRWCLPIGQTTLSGWPAALSEIQHVFIMKGGMRKKERHATVEKLGAIPDGVPRVLLATGSYIGEGFDDSRLDTLFLTMPISWRGTLQQYVGRLHRIHHGKKVVRVFDYVDALVPMLGRMYEKRLKGYSAIGYEMESAS